MEDKMNFFGKLKLRFNKNADFKKAPLAADFTGGTYTPLFSVSYNGEKNLGEMGPIKNYRPDYEALRLRSWQSYLDSEITQSVLNKFTDWVIGKGLKLQAEPVKEVLKSAGFDVNTQKFSESVEARFKVFCESSMSDYSEMENADTIAETAFKNAIIGGDVLVVLRYVNGNVNVQLIDGCHVQSPAFGSEYYPQTLSNGNKIINGIERDKKGKHIRYYVRTEDYKIVPVEAFGAKSGLQMAFLVYGLKYRLNNVRGLPLISAVLETLKKLERYKEATVGSAEERQKIAFSIEHGIESTGENPLAKGLAKAFDYDSASDKLPKDISGVELSNLVTATTNKQAINMPIGAQLKILESKNELYFKDFYSVNIDIVCAALSIPPNVAMSKYDANFSASRAALKDWEYILLLRRKRFANQFYQKLYNFFLHIDILKNNISAPGYLEAAFEGDNMVLTAYRTARFVGASVPHIDPLKEVKAERAKLGTGADAIPLTTVEAATEALNGGESDANMEQFASELERAKELEIIVEEKVEEKPPANQ